MTKAKTFIQWWVTSRLPKVHIFISPEDRPKGIDNLVRVYFRKWVIHPIKRRVARYYLKFLQKFFGLTVIGITGSAGKTSTKEMTASILRQKGETVASFANIDPVYNIPTTILSAKPWTKFLVLEMGVEYPGEMDFYLWLAKPHIGVITNIYPTHTEFLGNEDGVFTEKAKLINALTRDDFAILNKNNKFLRSLQKKLKANTIWFGRNSEIYAKNLEFDIATGTNFTLVLGPNKIHVHLPILGQQFVENALASASTGHILGLSIGDIKRGIESFVPPEHRMRPIKLANGAWVIDDSYNNNPKAAEESLGTFTEVAGSKKKIIVFGDMLELGNLEEGEHKKIGALLVSIEIYYLIGVGAASKLVVDEFRREGGERKVEWVESWEEVLPFLRPLLKKDTITLIKGSRSIGLDKVADLLKDEKEN